MGNGLFYETMPLEIETKPVLQEYLCDRQSAFPMSPDVGRMNILENSRERTAGAMRAGAALP